MTEIEKLLKECWKAGKKYGGNWTDKNFNDFMDKHQEQVKLFAIPVVVLRSEQLLCEDCGGKIDEIDAWCKHCGEVIG